MEKKFGHLKKDQKMTSLERKFFRITAGYTLFDNKSYEEILVDLKVEPDDMKLRKYKSNRLTRIARMSNSMPKIM